MNTLPFWFKFIAVIVTVGLMDLCWTKYFIWVAKKHALKAAIWSCLTMLCSVLLVVSYVEDKRLLLAAIMGSFIGTYLTVKHSK